MLTLRGAGHAALPVCIEALRGVAAGRVILTGALRRMLLRIGLIAGMLLLIALRIRLTARVLLLIALRVLLRLLLILGCVDVAPAAAAIRLLPA